MTALIARAAPTAGTLYAARKLNEAANAAGPMRDGAKYQLTDLHKGVETAMHKKYGRDFGPVRNSESVIYEWLQQGLAMNYRLDDPGVVDKFVDFILAVSTCGFMDEDTTGTLTGGRDRTDWGGHWQGKK
jgi:hypothetical protein